jgi:hypothetical protein
MVDRLALMRQLSSYRVKKKATTASGSFTGFGSSDDDVIVNDPLSASSGMTIKRPTMEQPIVDDPNLNMRNGASDGAGQPDGIDNGGGVINADVPDIFNDSTGELLNPERPSVTAI